MIKLVHYCFAFARIGAKFERGQQHRYDNGYAKTILRSGNVGEKVQFGG